MENANGEKYIPGKCFECKRGEHEDEDENYTKVLVRDPNTHKIYGRGFVCAHHFSILEEDGYLITKL